jgi:hypothetical protein
MVDRLDISEIIELDDLTHLSILLVQLTMRPLEQLTSTMTEIKIFYDFEDINKVTIFYQTETEHSKLQYSSDQVIDTLNGCDQ